MKFPAKTLSVVERTTGILAILVAVALAGYWWLQFVLTPGVLWLLELCWIVMVVGTIGVLLGVAAYWFLARPTVLPGMVVVTAGLALLWGWWWLDRTFDLWGAWAIDQADPTSVDRANLGVWVHLGVDVVAALVLVVGGVLLERRIHSRDSDPVAG
jgi:hypothetical protein